MSYTYYHNPRCSKSRQGLVLLEDQGLELTVKEYLKDGFEKSELEEIFKKLGKGPLEVVRSKETIFGELELRDKDLDLEQWIDIIIANPVLMERPMLVTTTAAVIGRPTEDLLTIV